MKSALGAREASFFRYPYEILTRINEKAGVNRPPKGGRERDRLFGFKVLKVLGLLRVKNLKKIMVFIRKFHTNIMIST